MGATSDQHVTAIDFEEPGTVKILDQRLLPQQEVYLNCKEVEQVAKAIEDMVLRGAPLIGITAAMGIAVDFFNKPFANDQERDSRFQAMSERLASTRPTAVNLFWAIRRMQRLVEASRELNPSEFARALREEANAIRNEDINMNLAMGEAGSKLFNDGDVILTHCNAGALATGGHGTALGVIRSTVSSGKNIRVFVDETRPYLQGSRLTAWELTKENIPMTLISDNMAGHCMQLGKVSAVLVGTDRIAANGDIANKIGTYALSVLAKEHGVPFYVAAPTSTIDMECPTGADIPIEERDASEVTGFQGNRVAPEGVDVYNPAFDVTPAENITAIITEAGVLRPPFEQGLNQIMADVETTQIAS